MAQEWKRVKDKRTDHEYSVVNVNEKYHEVLDKPATRANGRPLPAKPNKRLTPATGVVAPTGNTADNKGKEANNK